ncbi:MAG: hypothetical protein A2150_01600 [Candidatus Muproteobacteria bacterium RBG_16_64_11]|uniref:non-specific serine/threonine protein kinase n=1 Tax=Candidatus Muproteobacteria bacterium RBG_16_64_11 TaxID=1817758 RepID=A0A1F6TI18_9PROT|nr:MAG: hypothetical protein A2150_01600 [Candidatus Muproteobacteria bacterium RBG_16_64_11]
MLKKTKELANNPCPDGRALPIQDESESIDIAAPGALADAINPGDTLGNYLILSKLGEGGMGMVYKAHDPTLDRMVALKVISPHLFRNQEYLDRFRVEAQAQARLNSPNIVTLHSMFQLPSWLVLVMEYVEGETLAQRLHNQGRLNFSNAVWIFEQVLLGVDRAHRMGVVHRDLKPGNIFITAGNEVKLMDFGVARMLDNKSLTLAGSMVGTLTYISPEQINGKEADFRSDIYTLGITLYEAVAGRPPFEYRTDFELMNAHLHDQPPRPSILQPDIAEDFEAMILRAIEKDPDSRYQTAREFRNALLRVGMTRIKAYEHLKKKPKTPTPADAGVKNGAWSGDTDDTRLENYYLESEPPPPPAAQHRRPIAASPTRPAADHMPFSMFPQKVRATGQYSSARVLTALDRRAARRRFLGALGLYGLLPPLVIALVFAIGFYFKSKEQGKSFFDLSGLAALWQQVGGARWVDSAEKSPATGALTGANDSVAPKPAGTDAGAPVAAPAPDQDKKYDGLRQVWR